MAGEQRGGRAFLLLLFTFLSCAVSDVVCDAENFYDGQCGVRVSETSDANAVLEHESLVQSKVLLRERNALHVTPNPQNHTSLHLLTTIDKYQGSELLVATPSTKEQLKVLEDLCEGPHGVDAWTEWNGVGLKCELMVPKDNITVVEKTIKAAGMSIEILIRDVAAKLQADHDDNMKQKSSGIVGKYPTLEELYAWYDTLPGKYSFVKIMALSPTTHEGRQIKVVKIAKREGLPIVLVECGLHPREWIALASCVWDINNLLTNTASDIQELVENLEFRFIPSANPDGYKYTHSGERLWRKNRNPNNGARCKGVDLNRNWDARWGNEGVSRTDKCSQVYCGTKAFSEPETQALSQHMLSEKGRIKAYIAFHSYTQLWLVPPGAGPKPDDFSRLKEVGDEAARRMGKLDGKSYQAGAPPDILYAASGGSFDWAHNCNKGACIKYSYTPELRPSRSRGRVGFQLPASEIVAASKEAFEGLKYVSQVVIKEYPAPKPTPAPTPAPTPEPTPEPEPTTTWTPYPPPPPPAPVTPGPDGNCPPPSPGAPGAPGPDGADGSQGAPGPPR